MHKKIIHTQLLNNVLISLGFGFILLFLFSTKAFAASPCTLSFEMKSDKASITSGDTVTRTVTVKNTGRTTCRNTSYSLFYSPNETFVSSTPAPRASDYYWYVGNLGPNKRAVMTVTTRHTTAVAGSQIVTEGCAAATGAADACAASRVAITAGTTAPVVVEPVPIVPTTPIAVAPTVPTVPTDSVTVPATNKKEQGMWIWNFPSQMLSAAADTQMKQLQSYGFNAVYITIDDYLDIAGMPAGTAKETAKKTYFDNLAKFVTKANSLSIAVDAEGGWKDWAKPANRWKGYALIDAVKEYNALHPEAKLRGFQYDVEPYLLPEYETSKASVLLDFVTFTDLSVQRLVGTDIQFSMAIPHFYDGAQAWTPSFAYNGKTTHAFSHLLNALEKKPGSDILIMSYRDYFEGANGTREISEMEIKEASAGYSTDVIVSQETGNVDPAFVTFYGSTKAVLFGELTKIDTAFAEYSRYGGTAVHYLDSFLVMR
jgi:uncharacterized repeat protein (TIGR01451 family)